MLALTGGGALSVLAVSSPVAFQVFQRNGSDEADIEIAGTVTEAAANVQARWNGGAWATIATGVLGAFTASLDGQAAGSGTLEVRIANRPSTALTVASVGVGDVFVIAGQSNASGRGETNQAYTGLPKCSLFGNDYLWRELADPTDSDLNQVDAVSDDGASPDGSYWPHIATHFIASQGVPCAFIPCSKGGSSISSWVPGVDHQNRATLYGSMVYRALQAGGCKAVLWHQGESNQASGTARATYAGHMRTLANAIWTDLGAPLMPCKLQHNAIAFASQSEQDAINNAIGDEWVANPAHCLTGPDLVTVDVTSATYGDGSVHITKNAGLQLAADLWWASMQAAFGYA